MVQMMACWRAANSTRDRSAAWRSWSIFRMCRPRSQRDEVEALLNGDNYTANGNYCSVKEYFRLMSSGALTYSNVVIGPIRLSQKRRYYVDHLLAKEALDLVSASDLDFSQFDSQGIAAIDAVSFLYAGETVWEGSLWPHNSVVKWGSRGYRAGMYQITGLGLHSSDLVIGTFCHESGHMLCRFPDLYDYGKRDGDFERSAGLGVYCLMSAGNHLNGGRTPAPICAYLRYLAEWCPNRISLNTPGVYQADYGAYDTVLVYETTRPNEFFLLENRDKFGLDQHLPANGLAIYHCDTEGSNERQGGTAKQHYQCSLLQADGRLDLEHNANQGDPQRFLQRWFQEKHCRTRPALRQRCGTAPTLVSGSLTSATTGKTITFRVPPRRSIMSTTAPSTETDPLALQRLQEQTKILQANLDFYKLTRADGTGEAESGDRPGQAGGGQAEGGSGQDQGPLAVGHDEASLGRDEDRREVRLSRQACRQRSGQGGGGRDRKASSRRYRKRDPGSHRARGHAGLLRR